MDYAKSSTKNPNRLTFTNSLIFKTLIPLIIIIFLIISIFGFYLFTATKNKSKEFLIENILMPEFELLAKEKNNDFENVKILTEFTAKEIEDKIQASKERTSEEINELFNKYMSKKEDGTYRSSLDESKDDIRWLLFLIIK